MLHFIIYRWGQGWSYALALGGNGPPNFFGNLIYAYIYIYIYIDTSLIFDSKIYTRSPLQDIYKFYEAQSPSPNSCFSLCLYAVTKCRTSNDGVLTDISQFSSIKVWPLIFRPKKKRKCF